jgi:hypothetical protein
VSEIFREIDEELRRENLLKLWSKYGRYLIAGIVVIALIVGGVIAWRDHQDSERRAQATRYNTALGLIRAGKSEEAAKLFDMLSSEGGGYGLLASLEQAEMAAKKGDRKAAIATYDHIAGSSGIDPVFRDLATLLSVMHGLPDLEPKAAIERLQPLTASDNSWHVSALDLTAAAKLKAGDRAGALEIYKKLADDLTVPNGLRARAAEMAAALKS